MKSAQLCLYGKRAFARFPFRVIVAAIAFLVAGANSFAYQSSTWRHARSEHFVVSYDRRTEERVGEALKIAEETRAAIVAYLGKLPFSGPISIVLADSADDPNGWASERDTLVYIDCRKAQMLLRGDTDWLRTVLTHELSHAISLAILRSPIMLQIGTSLTSEAENATASASYLFGDDKMPVWFIEGIAQMGSNRLGADSRDAVREMVLRDAARSGRLLDLSQMARFEGSALESELAYNQGYSLLLFLESEYPDVPLLGFCALVKKTGFRSAFRIRYRESIESLYAKWKEDLLARSEGGGAQPPGQKVFGRNGLYVLETACAARGEYVVANWGNDYERFGLFRKGRGGAYSRIAEDIGRTIKSDRETGDLWFAKSVYDYSSGVDDYDLFVIPAGGKAKRVTRGARCLAFDALGGRLLYAKYRNGTTSLVSREPDGAEAVIAELPYGMSVYSISVIAADRAMLSLGTADGVRIAVLADGELRFLWEESDATDLAFAGADRVVFSSAAEGSPQIYWADLVADPGAWYRITDAPAGCRFPSFESGDSGETLYYSRYEEGGYRIYRLENPFTTEYALRVEGGLADEPMPAPPAADGDAKAAKSAPSNIVLDVWPIYAGFDVWKDELLGDVQQVTTSVSAGLSLYDAPDDLGVDCSFGLAFPYVEGYDIPPWLSFGAEGSFAIGPTRNGAGISVETQSYGGGYSYSYRDFSASSRLQVASDQVVELDYSYVSYLDTTYGSAADEAVEYYGRHALGLWWSCARTTRSRFDPAGLGGDWRSIQLGAVVYSPAVINKLYYPSSDGYLNDHRNVYRLAGEAGFHSLLGGGKLGIGATILGFSILNGYEGSLHAPNVFPTIGGDGSFSGYPSGYARVSDLARAEIEVAVNPFVDKKAKTRPIERASLTLKLEAGLARCFEEGLVTEYPLSVEARLRQGFYLAPNRESSLFFAFAMPLNDFIGSLGGAPFQIYAGYSY